MRAYVIDSSGQIINTIVANPEIDTPPEGCTLVAATEEIPDSNPASGQSADIG